jgi:hypothetical protein
MSNNEWHVCSFTLHRLLEKFAPAIRHQNREVAGDTPAREKVLQSSKVQL